MKKSLALAHVVIGCALLTEACGADPQDEPHGSTTSHLDPSALCGVANMTTLDAAPQGDALCTQGRASAVTGSGPWDWTCTGISGEVNNCSALSTKDNINDPVRDQHGALLRTIYAAIFGSGPSDYVYYYWVDRYNPPTVGCAALVEAFLLASPARAAAAAATVQTDPALISYIHLLYKALLLMNPGDPGDNTSRIAGWRQSGFVTMDQLDAIFMAPNTTFPARCNAAGMEL